MKLCQLIWGSPGELGAVCGTVVVALHLLGGCGLLSGLRVFHALWWLPRVVGCGVCGQTGLPWVRPGELGAFPLCLISCRGFV